MTILFLTGGLEPGKDGVGDYTRRLAAACVRQGHFCAMIALQDSHLLAPVETVESPDGCGIPTLRLPAAMPWPERIRRAGQFWEGHAVDWCSLQFVAYGFDRKGIVGQLGGHLAPLVERVPLHIMFHELWIGIGEEQPPLKERLVGAVQKHAIKKMLHRLRPRAVTTSNPFFRSLLARLGWNATELPLFGNIPVEREPDGTAMSPILLEKGICDDRGAHSGRWIGLFFGTLHPEWQPEPLMSILLAASKKAQRRVSLVSAGRLGVPGEAVWQNLRNDYGQVVDFCTLGELPAATISALMRLADFGIAASPWHLIGKSGAAAAMLDHGLPVIVTRDAFRPQNDLAPAHDALLHRCDPDLESKLAAGLPRRPAYNRVDDVVRDFIRCLAD